MPEPTTMLNVLSDLDVGDKITLRRHEKGELSMLLTCQDGSAVLYSMLDDGLHLIPVDEVTAEVEWDAVLDGIQKEAIGLELTDIDTIMVWNIGVAAYRKIKELGARFPHDPCS